MIEELLIKIKSVLDNDGFRKAEASMKGLQGTSKQALGEAAAHSGYFNAEMNKTPGLLDRAKNSMNQLGISTKQLGLGLMTAGAAGLAAMTYFSYMAVQAAAGSEQIWGRLTVALGKSGMEMKAVKAEYSGMIDSLQANTARMKGDIVTSVGSLARVGVANKEIAQHAVEAQSALAFLKYPGDPQGFSTVSEAWTNIINKPQLMSKSLTTLGIDTAKFNTVLAKNGLTMKDWGNLTSEQRSSLLDQTVALQGGAAANEEYKRSYEGMMNELTQLWKSFITDVGYEILPILKEIGTTMFPILKGMLEGFKALPTPVKDLLIVLGFLLPLIMLIAGAGIYFWPLISAVYALATAEGVAAIAGWAALTPLLAIAALGTIFVAIVVMEDISTKRLDDPNYFTDIVKTGGMTPEQVPQAENQLDEVKNKKLNEGPFGLPNFTIDAAFQNYDYTSKIQSYLDTWKAGNDKASADWVTTVNGFKTTLGGGINYIKGAWSNTVSWLRGLWNRLRVLWGQLTSYIRGAWSNTVSYFRNLAKRISDAGSNAFWGVYNAAKTWMDNTYAYVAGIVGNIKTQINSIPGGSFITGFITGDNAGGDGSGIVKGKYTGLGLKPTTTNKSSTKHVTLKPTIKIDHIGDKETADYFLTKATIELDKILDASG